MRSVHFVSQAWVNSEASTLTNGVVVGRSHYASTVEAAKREAIDRLTGQLLQLCPQSAFDQSGFSQSNRENTLQLRQLLTTKLALGEIESDFFCQRFGFSNAVESRDATLYRAAIRCSADATMLSQIVRHVQANRFANLRMRQKLVGGIAALSLLVGVLYALANSITLGYYTGRLRVVGLTIIAGGCWLVLRML